MSAAMAMQVSGFGPGPIGQALHMVAFAGMDDRRQTPGPGEAAADWARVRGILERALEIDASRRPAFLDQACGQDTPLRAEVESLLAAAGGSGILDSAPMLTQTVTNPDRTAAPGDLPRGHVLGHYTIGDKLGEGGMGAVYLAVDNYLNRKVALKVIARGGGGEAHERKRFAREAQAASALNHPNVVTIYEFQAGEAVNYIAMEFIEGETLREVMQRPSTPQALLIDYARQAASAVAAAHSAGIAHRDLKPANIMVTRAGAVKVLDFGLAKATGTAPAGGGQPDPDITESAALTAAGMVVGTPAYMSPEQAMGEATDYRSDIFSFGVILFEMVCGVRPFQGKTNQATLFEIAKGETPHPAEVNPGVSARMAALIEHCLQKAPEARPRSMDEVARELGSINTIDPPAPPAVTTAATRLALRRRAAIGLMLLAIAAALTVGWKFWPKKAVPIADPVVLTYSLEAQKMANGAPVGAPYAALPQDVFEAGWKFRLRAQGRRDGYLYIVNDGPDQAGGNRLWVLYPSIANVGAKLVSGQQGETGWFVFDRNPGTERVWVIWSPAPEADLEASVRAGLGGKVAEPVAESRLRSILGALEIAQATAGSEDPAQNHDLELRTPAGNRTGTRLDLQHR